MGYSLPQVLQRRSAPIGYLGGLAAPCCLAAKLIFMDLDKGLARMSSRNLRA